MMDGRRAAGVVGAVAALSYANSLANQFTYDDWAIVPENALVRNGHVLAAFTSPYWPPNIGGGQYRPLTVASYILDWWASHGAAWWFHAVNVAWHVVVCLLVWRLLVDVLPRAGALAGALLFAVHPVHVEAIANVVGRSELMMTAGVLGALLLHRRRHWAAVLCFAFAVLCKENGIVFVGLAVASDLLLGGDLKARRWLYAGYAGVVVAYLGALDAVVGFHGLAAPAKIWVGLPVGERWLTMLSVIPDYAWLMVAPIDLKVDYGPAVTTVATGVTPAVVSGAVLVACAVAMIGMAWRRAPVVAAGVLWFVIAVGPVANIVFPSGIILAERTLYLPSVGAVMIAAWSVARAVESPRRRMVEWGVAVVCVAFAARGWVRTPIWHDNKSFVITALGEEPTSYRLHLFAAEVLMRSGQPAAADTQYTEARQLFGRDVMTYRGAADCAVQMHDYARASVLLDSAIAVAPFDSHAYIGLAQVRVMQERWGEAERLAQQAYLIAPNETQALEVVGIAGPHLADPRAAEATYRRAIGDHPTDQHLRAGYATMLLALGDTAGAQQQRLFGARQ
jgi:protein O-mannosyl-transferase